MKSNTKMLGALVSLAFALPAIGNAATNSLYGKIRYSFNSIDDTALATASGNADDDPGSTISGENNASILGFKGNLKESNGLTAFYHIQTAASIDTDGQGDAFNQRFALAGVKGDFGKVTIGRVTTPYKAPGLKNDPFYFTSAGLNLGVENYGLSKLNAGWTDNSIVYNRKFGTFMVDVGLFIDDSTEDEHDFNIGFGYDDGTFSAGLQYLTVGDTRVVANSIADSTATRLYAIYKMDQFKFFGSYETIDPDAADDSSTFIYLAGTYHISDATRAVLSFGTVEDAFTTVNGTPIPLDGSGFTIAAFHKIMKNTEVHALFSDVSGDDDDVAIARDRSVFALGFSYAFSLTQSD